MEFKFTKAAVQDQGKPPDWFLKEQVLWARAAFALKPELFSPNQNYDIFNKVFTELGPWDSELHRVAVICEVERVLAGFESSWNHNEGVDMSRRNETTNENAEAGAWQMSYDARHLDPSIQQCLIDNHIRDGAMFQQFIKTDHPFSMEFITRVLRVDVKDYDRIASGPVRKVNGYNGKDERRLTWPTRPRFWSEDESIYPWLSRKSVAEFAELIANA